MSPARTNPSREAAEALRAAVDRTFQATVDQATASRDRAQTRAQDIAQELVDDLSQAAGRVRDALDDLRVATREDLRDIAQRLDSIEERVHALETAARPAAARRPAAKRAAAKPAARKPAARKPAAKKPAAARAKRTTGK